jgi:hypothetical protein
MKFQRTSQVFIVRSGGRNLHDIMTGLFINEPNWWGLTLN